MVRVFFNRTAQHFPGLVQAVLADEDPGQVLRGHGVAFVVTQYGLEFLDRLLDALMLGCGECLELFVADHLSIPDGREYVAGRGLHERDTLLAGALMGVAGAYLALD